ncbi:MAG: IPT/TIG domain-containing protein, partial [Proteobacteria bacterium]|nr:IPT/TIG domain-containing protein [Pseudomonadota bacterium]
TNQLQVRAPSGSFGEADVTVESLLFSGESSVGPQPYFYAAKETGSVALDDSAPAPVSAILRRGQLVYAVSGGGFEAIDTRGRVRQLTTDKARLSIIDISDPVRPVLVENELAEGVTEPFHFDTTLPPQGFSDLAGAGDDLYAAGGSDLFHFDLTLATDPLLLSQQRFEGEVLDDLEVVGDVVFLSSDAGVSIFKRLPDRTLSRLTTLPADALGGRPSALRAVGDTLWVLLPEESELLALDLMAGDYAVTNRVTLVDLAGNPLDPEDVLFVDDLAFVSGGRTATVTLFALRPDGASQAVAELALAFLIRDGDLFAGELNLVGQDLYVAAGQGDLQVFDVSPWLDGSFRRQLELEDYFSVVGAVNTVEVAADAVYAGTSFVYVDGEPAENPVPEGVSLGSLGGGVNTLANDNFAVLAQVPTPRGVLPANDAVEIQLNRLVDNAQFAALADLLLQVTRGGEPVPGFVSRQTGNEGTLLSFRPAQAFEPGVEYRVALSGALRDLSGQELGRDYGFRFVAEAGVRPEIARLSELFGSARGGSLVTIFGAGFGPGTTVEVGGVLVDPADLVRRSDDELAFVVPPLPELPAENRLVGLRVANGLLSQFRPAAFTYVTDPAIERIGRFDAASGTFTPADRRFAFNSGATLAIEGPGLASISRLEVNGRPATGVRIVDERRIAFDLPDDTLGTLTVAVSNQPDESDLVANRNARIGIDTRALTVSGSVGEIQRAGPLLLLTASNTAQLFSTQGGPTPVLLSRIDTGSSIRAAGLSGRRVVLATGEHELEVYDITNPTVPRLVNRIVAPDDRLDRPLYVRGEAILVFGESELLLGRSEGIAFERFAVDYEAAAADGDLVYLLRRVGADVSVEARALFELNVPIAGASAFVTLVGADEIAVAGQRLLVASDSGVQVFSILYEAGSVALASLGSRQLAVDFGDVALNGELLAASDPVGLGDEIHLFDVGSAGAGEVTLTPLANVIGTGGRAASLGFETGVLEWNGQGQYRNAVVPLPNISDLRPGRFITSDAELLALEVQGLPLAWQDVV